MVITTYNPVWSEPDYLCCANVTLNGVSSVSGNSNPQNCVIYGTSTNPETYTFNGQTTFYGVVYAPNAAVTFNGTSDMFGSVICKTFLANGSGDIHYDEALKGSGNGVVMTSGEKSRIEEMGRRWAKKDLLCSNF